MILIMAWVEDMPNDRAASRCPRSTDWMAPRTTSDTYDAEYIPMPRTPQTNAGSRIPKRGSPKNQMNNRSEEHTSELQSLMRISYAVFCLKKKKKKSTTTT